MKKKNNKIENKIFLKGPDYINIQCIAVPTTVTSNQMGFLLLTLETVRVDKNI